MSHRCQYEERRLARPRRLKVGFKRECEMLVVHVSLCSRNYVVCRMALFVTFVNPKQTETDELARRAYSKRTETDELARRASFFTSGGPGSR
jgi:hypothetical protein